MSGNVGRSDEIHFVMSGVCVYENAIHHLITELDETVSETLNIADSATLELHGSPMSGGRAEWRKIPRDVREALLAKALQTVVTGKSRYNVSLFGAAVNKAAVSPEDPVEHAYEQLVTRFDKFLTRVGNGRKRSKQRGIIVVDKSRYEDTLQAMAQQHRRDGTSWGKLRNLSEVPLFVDSRASRLIQLADLVSYALWRRYEYDDLSLITPIVSKFDNQGGIYHGLYHKTPDRSSCQCAACASRR